MEALRSTSAENDIVEVLPEIKKEVHTHSWITSGIAGQNQVRGGIDMVASTPERVRLVREHNVASSPEGAGLELYSAVSKRNSNRESIEKIYVEYVYGVMRNMLWRRLSC